MAGVLSAGAEWELVSTAGRVTAEGVVAAPDGDLYLVDITTSPPHDRIGGTIYRFNPVSGETTNYLEPSGLTLGLHFDRDGMMWMAQGGYGGGRALAKHDLTTKTTTVVTDNYRGRRFLGCNDLTSDAQGRIFFTDCLIMAPEPPELPHAVYRYDPDGTLHQLITDIVRPNGIEVSPDGSRLYVAITNSPRIKVNPHAPKEDRFGTVRGAVAVYDLDRNGNVSNGRLFYRNDEAMADGMTMDTDGNLYVALFDPPQRAVVAINPAGQVIETFPLPERGNTNQLGFGRGVDAHVLYLTTGHPWQLFRIATNRTGHYF
jgi:gluconolactonase